MFLLPSTLGQRGELQLAQFPHWLRKMKVPLKHLRRVERSRWARYDTYKEERKARSFRNITVLLALRGKN